MKKIFLFFIIWSLAAAQMPPVRIPILMYHHIRAPQLHEMKMLQDLSSSPETFHRHLYFLKSNGYVTVTFEDINNYFTLSQALPKKPIVLTFDDGYQDNWNAFLELKNWGMKGVFFIITSKIGAKDHLDATEIKLMSVAGMEIGSHTKDHYPLTLTRRTRYAQIVDSKKILEALLHKPVISFCYPSGRFNKASLSIVKEAGYAFARTTESGVSTFHGQEYLLKTIRIHNYTGLKELQKYLK